MNPTTEGTAAAGAQGKRTASDTREAAQQLAALLNELHTDGISVEAGEFGVLCLSTDTAGYVGHVFPPDAVDTVWRVEML